MRRTPKAVVILATIELLIMNVLAMAQAAPKILLIAREPLNPGAEAEYDRKAGFTSDRVPRRPLIEQARMWL